MKIKNDYTHVSHHCNCAIPLLWRGRGGLILFSLFLFACTNSGAFVSTDTTQNKLLPTNDSGFVTKKEGVAFLLANSLTDTTPHKSHWDMFIQTDTIGKYYKINNSDNYIMCLSDYGYEFGDKIIIEITSNGDLVKSERFSVGVNTCCWYNEYEGFSKYGDFFGIKVCGTGSGHCSSRLYLFKEVTPQDSINDDIPLNCWSNSDSGDDSTPYDSYTSSMEIKKDELVILYVLESGTYTRNEKTKKLDFKIDSSEKFAIRYFYKNGKWDTEDKDKLEKLEQCY